MGGSFPSTPKSMPTRTPTASLVGGTVTGTMTTRFRAADSDPVRQRTGLPLPLVLAEPRIHEAVAPTPSMHWWGPRTRPPGGAVKVPPKRMILPGLPTPGLTVVGFVGLTPTSKRWLPLRRLATVGTVGCVSLDQIPESRGDILGCLITRKIRLKGPMRAAQRFRAMLSDVVD
jgi:hypothetical protein